MADPEHSKHRVRVTTRGAGVDKYTPLLELGSGGSASVWVAVSDGAEGSGKLVVLKAMRAELGEDEATSRMFLVEAQLSARLKHPSLIQVHEVFRRKGLPVIVMDYVAGQSLETLNARLVAMGGLPLPVGAAIVARVLAGLHYAHTLTDESGEPMELVHRDVSPQNVMIGYDGQVKLVDFGIAKQLSQGSQTRTGVLKGKLHYMAPEQVQGEVDRRTDIFAAGIVLWEIAARGPFWGKANETAILRCLVTGELPQLRQAVPGIESEIERICARALAVDPADRYSTAAEMQRDLEGFVSRQSPPVTDAVIGAWVDRCCRDLRERTETTLRERLALVAQLSAGAPPARRAGEPNPSVSARRDGVSSAAPPTPGPLPRTPRRTGSVDRRWLAGLALLIALGGAAFARWKLAGAPGPSLASPAPGPPTGTGGAASP